jgi:hypothetical protein
MGNKTERLTLVQLMRVPAARAVWRTGKLKVNPSCSFLPSCPSVPISVKNWSTELAI